MTGRDSPDSRDSRDSRDTAASLTLWVNGERRAYAPGTTLAALIAELSRAPSGIAAAVNEAVVPRGRWPETALADGDRIEVLTAVQGG